MVFYDLIMANLKRIELSNELMLSFLKDMNIPDDSVITYCEKDRIGIVLYIHSKEFEETKEGFTPGNFHSKPNYSLKKKSPPPPPPLRTIISKKAHETS